MALEIDADAQDLLPVAFCEVGDCYGHDPDSGRDILRKFAGFQADDQVHNAVLRACATAGLYKRAIYIINKIIEAGNTPSATAYSNAVAACGARAGRRGLLLFEEMQSKGLAPTPAAYLGIMQAHLQSLGAQHCLDGVMQGHWQSVLQHFDDLKAQPGRSGRVPYAAYSSAMRALQMQRSQEDSQLRKRGIASKQLKIFQEMLADGICHNLAAAALADRYEPVQGTQLLEEVMQMGYQPSGGTFGAGQGEVCGWENLGTGSCEAILRVLPLSRDGEITEEQKRMLYEEGVRGFLTESASDAERFLGEMKDNEANFDVNDDLYSSIVTGASDPATAARAYRALNAPGAAGATVAVAAMAALTELKCWDDALEIFQETGGATKLGRIGLEGSIEQAGTVALKACAAGGKWQEALEVLEHIRFRGLPLSPPLYEEAVAACAKQQDEARRLVGKMMAAGYEPSERALLAAELTSSELERQGFSLPEDLVKAAIAEAKAQGHRDLARDLSLKLRVAKTGVAEPRAVPKRGKAARRQDKRQRRATVERTSRDDTMGKTDPEDVELPEMDDWDQWDEDEDPKDPKSWEERVHDLATTLQSQNEALGVEKGHVHSIKAGNNNSTSGMQSQLNDVKRYFGADIQRMLQEFEVQSNLQQAENVRLQQQVTALKGEKTSVHQQIIALQRRIEELEEELGHE
eukprot:s384_g16.t1